MAFRANEAACVLVLVVALAGGVLVFWVWALSDMPDSEPPVTVQRVMVPNGDRYWYTAVCERVVDGDTVDMQVDLGFGIVIRDRFRLLGVDAWETRGEERERGLAAAARLRELVEGKPLLIHTRKDERGKYGRWLADIYVDDVDVGATLVEEGHAERVTY